MLSINLLGSPRLTRHKQVVKVPRRKSRALLYYLAAQGVSISREHLLSVFWPDHDRAAAQQLLRTTLHGLRNLLGNDLLVSKESLDLSPEVAVDVREFEALLATSPLDLPALENALALYRGDFLADFSLPGVAAFENWAVTQREHYRRLAVRGYTVLSRLYEGAHSFADALNALDRALLIEPLQEDLQQAALRLHYLAGDRAGAIRRYDQLRKLLDEQLGVPPMIETRELYQLIITDKLSGADQPAVDAPRRPLASSPVDSRPILPFIGRNSELQTLRSLAGSRKLAMIEGEPGIGKTRLANEFIGSIDVIPLVSAARELEGSLPYLPIIEALRALIIRPDWPMLSAELHASTQAIWLSEVARLLPDLAGKAGSAQTLLQSAEEARLWEGVHQFLLGIARRKPVLLFLDDLQWADAATLALLDYLVRQPSAAPLSFLAAARPVPPRSPAAALIQVLARENRIARIELNRLELDEVTAIARHLAPKNVEPLSDWLMRSCEGNPFVLAELIRDIYQQGILRADGSIDLEALPGSPIVPQTVYGLIQARLERLSGAARRILDAAVAVGRSFEFDLVARAAGLSEDAALDALDELRVAGLVHPLDGNRYTFDHNLTMEVAYREVGEPRHRFLHRRVAEAMEGFYSKRRLENASGSIAFHFFESGAPERAAPYARLAARMAMQLAAWKEAIDFYEMALSGAAPDQQWELYMALGEAHFQASEYFQAVETLQKALQVAQKRGDQKGVELTKLSLAQSLLLQARYDEVIDLVSEVSRADEPARAMQAEIVWGTALSVEGSDLQEAAAHLNRAASFCGGEGNAESLAQIKFELGSIAAQQGDLVSAIALYREALEMANQSTSETGFNFQILAHNNLAYHLLLLGDGSAENYARQGLKLAREQGNLGLQPYLFSTLGEISLANGEIDVAERYFREGLTLAEKLAMPERIAGLTANLGLVAQQLGQTMLAIHRLSLALAKADSLGTRHLAAQIRIWLAPLLPLPEARAHLAEARTIAESSDRRRLIQEIEAIERQLPLT